VILFVNWNALHPGAAIVVGKQEPRPANPLAFVLGEILSIDIYLVDGAGNYEEHSGDGANSLKVALGVIGSDPIAFQETWAAIANGFRGTFSINTVEAAALLGSEVAVDCVFEIQLTDVDGIKKTLVQADTQLLQQLIGNAPTAPAELDDYTSTEQLNKSFVQNRFSITALTGGTSTDLDGIPTVSMAAGTMVAIVQDGTVFFYQILNSNEAETSPFFIRPDDYNNPDNAKVWKLVSQFGGATSTGFTHEQTSPDTVWTVVHNFGYRPAGITVWIAHDLDEKLCDCQIIHVDNTTFEVRHLEARAGLVRCL
jgi:hypothetical protein